MKKYLLPLLAGVCLLAGCTHVNAGHEYATGAHGHDATQGWLNSLALVQPDVTRVLTGVRDTRRAACHEQLDKTALIAVAENSPTFARLLRQTTLHPDAPQTQTGLRAYTRCDVVASSI